MQNNPYYTIDTGAPRHVLGHAVSGAIAVGLVSAIKNAKDTKEGKIEKTEAIKSTVKQTLQGSIATATAIGVANALGSPDKSAFQALGALAIGLGSIYAIEKNSDKVLDKITDFYASKEL